MPQIKQMKTLAKAYLGKNGNWLKMVLAGLGLVFVCFVPWLLANDCLSLLLGEEDASAYWITPLLWWGILLLWMAVLTVPALALFYWYAWRLYVRARDGALCEARRMPPFSRMWCVGFLTLLRPVVIRWIFEMAYMLASASDFWLWLPLAAVAIGLSFLMMWGTGSLFCLPYRFCRGNAAWASLRKSARDMRGNFSLYARYMLSFLGWILLSLLTAGMLLAVYVLPLMMFTYFALGDALSAKQTQEE